MPMPDKKTTDFQPTMVSAYAVGHHDDDTDELIYLWRMVAVEGSCRALVIASTDDDARAVLNAKFANVDAEQKESSFTWVVEEVIPLNQVPFLVCSVADGEVKFPGGNAGVLEKH